MIDPKQVTYQFALRIFNVLVNLFFREIRARGSHRIPTDGPIIYVVAPHANQFVDPIMVMRECKRQVSFLIAEKSMHEKGIGFFARMVNAIPVIRPQDLAVAGTGTIQLLDRKLEPFRIVGKGTRFLTQLQPQHQIALPHKAGQAEVVKVLSDTELIIKREFKGLKALALLSEGSSFKCIPHVDQDSVYQCVHDQLNQNKCITIFPEGGSHDRAELLPLKAGVTMMALGAMAKYPGLDVKIVPCACGKLLDTIYDALKSVTVNAGSYETLMMIQAARRLYKPAHRKLHISQVVDLNRRFLIGYNLFKHEPQVEELHQRVLAYNQLLKYHGIRDHQVCKTDLGGKYTLVLLLKRCFILVLLTLCGFPGVVLNLPVIVVAKIISEKKANAALKGSSVKIAGRDVLATWKLLVGLVLVPALYSFFGFLVFLSLVQTNLDFKWKLLIPLGSIVFISAMSYASLQFCEIGMDIARSLQPLITALLDPESVMVLRQNRSKLSRDITDIINEYGPQAFDDFDAEYISRTMISTHSHSPTSPSSTPSKSTSSFNLSAMRNRLPRLRSGFFQQATRMEWLDDKNIFTWGGNSIKSITNKSGSSSQDSLDDGYFWTRFMSRSGSESSTPFRSRSNSFAMTSSDSITGLSMTSLTNTASTVSDSSMTLSPEQEHFNRFTFKIQDLDTSSAINENMVQEDEGYADDQGLEFKKKK
ncbi:hypothetical protein BCR42DRAFT_463471 [Absidia repens]|uniref:Phospholipid/glycerol acyltransferase domain-containing protein n=1 Tax=Absidia repens TaxID=90262 RepID=A0A1X2HXN2_9FUNG|nr:hypothetical protein BCR42DRAFT_463471 [Absidia repens]